MAVPATNDALKAGTLLRDGWGLVRSHPLQLALPLVLLGLLTGGGGDEGGRRFVDTTPDVPWYAILAMVIAGLVLFAVLLVVLAVVIVLSATVLLMASHAALAAARGQPVPEWGDSFQAVRPRIVTAAIALFLTALVVGLGLVLLVVPGILVLGALLPLFAVLVTERKSAVASMAHAWDLTKGHRWDLFLVVAAGVGVAILSSFVLGWLPIIGDALAGAVFGVVQAVWIAAAALFFVRRHGTLAPPVAAAPSVLSAE
jgi:hypothetical protein